jgi:hypothetical protein
MTGNMTPQEVMAYMRAMRKKVKGFGPTNAKLLLALLVGGGMTGLPPAIATLLQQLKQQNPEVPNG